MRGSLVAFATADGDSISESDIVGLRAAIKPGEVNLSRTVITDSGLVHLPETTEKLAIAHTKVTDEGLAHLKRLRLQRLNMAHTNVTDSGLAKLKELTSLVWLNVTGTKVSAKGLEELKQTLPALTIVNEQA